MKVCISAGHGKYIRGASGYIDEYDENVRVGKRSNELINTNGGASEFFTDTTSTSQNTNLNTIVNWHNSRSRDLDVSVHFNAYQTTSKPMGVEVLYVTQSSLASQLSSALASTLGLPNRGAKYRSDLFFLNSTNKPAILIEVCFVDSSADANAYKAKFEAVCKTVAEIVGKVTIGAPPIEPPVEPPAEITGNNVVNIVATSEGNPLVTLNGEAVNSGNPNNRCDFTVKITGDVVLNINGQDFQVKPPAPTFQSNHSNIVCSVFGGASDPNDSAYPPYDTITDQERSCALPWKWTNSRPRVLVHNIDTNRDVVCNIRDVGPWLIDDDDYVLGNARPVAEPKGSTIPRGKNQGKTSNGAGIDLTPAAAKAIGLSGMGTVHWRFIEEGEAVS